MFDKDFFKEIWYAISQNKVRSTLTAFGVFWGIFMLVTLAGVGNGLRNGIEDQFKGMAVNSSYLWTSRTSKPYKGYKKERFWQFKNTDMDAVKENVKEVQYIVPRLQGWRLSNKNNVVYRDRIGTFQINGDYPDLVKVEPIRIAEGRFINDMDIKNKRKVCVIGSRVREELFKKGTSPIGKYIKVSGVYFQVVGIFKNKRSSINMGGDIRKKVCIPYTTMQNTFNYGNSVYFFSFSAYPQYDVAEVEQKVMAILKKRNSVAPDDAQAIGHINVAKQFKKVTSLFMGINLLTLIVGLGTMLAGVIGISNIMLVIVKERTNEIGIRRAIGATPYNVIVQILTESVLLTLSAGYVGMLLGILLNEALGLAFQNMSDNIFLNPGIDLWYGIKSLTILVVAGLLAGWLPAQKAVNVRPIEALRYE